MEIGRKIYYELNTGNVIKLTESRSGSVVETTLEQDFQNYTELNSRVKNSVGVIQLNYGDFEDNFAKYPFHIDTTKNTIDENAIVWDTGSTFGASLSDVQTSKIAQINDFYNQALASPFSSLGVQYLYTEDAQASFQKLFLLRANGLVTYPFTIFSATGNMINLDEVGLTQLLKDIAQREQMLQYKQHNFQVQVLACDTVDAVNTIQISF